MFSRRLGFFLLAAAIAGCNSDKVIHLPSGLAVSPTSLDFHVVTVGQSSALSLTLSSQTSSPVTIHAISVSGSGAAAFALSGVPAAVSSQSMVTVTFTPTSAATYSAKVSISSNDPDHPTITVPLSGVGVTEDIEVAVEAVDGGVGSASDDGGLSIAFGLDTWAAGPAAWPNILIENVGGASARLIGATMSSSSDAGAFFFPTPPVVPQTIAAQQTRVLPIAFGVPLGAQLATPDQSATVTLTFDDPRTPSVTIALSGQVPVASPPSVCAGIVSAQELDGSIETPTAFGSLVPIEPGSLLELSAFSGDLVDGGAHACTADAAFGRAALTYEWTVIQAPAGSTAAPTLPNAPRTDFTPDVVGHYVISLAVTDPVGGDGVAASAGANQIAFDAAPLEDLTVIAAWPDYQGVDLDLHFVRPGSQPFDPTGDVCALNAGDTHDWSRTGDPTGDPHYGGDDQGNGTLQERAWLNHPGESCLPDGGCAFGLWVHYYQDNRSLAGAASCTLPGCIEGQSCGCPSQQACEPNPGSQGACAEEVGAEAQVYFRGQLTPALSLPIPPELLLLPSPCFMWHPVDVVWAGDAGTAMTIGDGGLESYWGDHTDETRQCAENDGGWAPRAPPTYP